MLDVSIEPGHGGAQAPLVEARRARGAAGSPATGAGRARAGHGRNVREPVAATAAMLSIRSRLVRRPWQGRAARRPAGRGGMPMRYLLLIYATGADRGRPAQRRSPPSRRLQHVHRGHQEPRASSRPARRSTPTSTATTVRVRDGETVTTDGPFAETKEALGGFYLIDARGPRRGDRARGEDPGARARLDRGPPDLGATAGTRRPATEAVGAALSRRTVDRARSIAALGRIEPPTPSSTASSARSRAGRSRR